MELNADLQNSSVDDTLQVLFILENTNEQIRQFNGEGPNVWTETRNYFRIAPIQQVCIGECDTVQIREQNGAIVIGKQCRKLSKKLRTIDSPTVFLVNGKGEIIGSQKGCFRGNTVDERLKLLLQMSARN